MYWEEKLMIIYPVFGDAMAWSIVVEVDAESASTAGELACRTIVM